MFVPPGANQCHTQKQLVDIVKEHSLNQVVDIPSYACKPKEVIGVRDRKASRKLVESYVDMIASGTMPPHLTFQKDKLAGEVTGLVSRQWVNLQINELLVVEYYSRK